MAALALNNMESHIAESVLEYLLNIIQDDEIGNMSKLAALAVLNKLFKTDTDHGLKYRCVQADLVCSLLIALDAGLSQTCHPADTVYVQVAMEIMWQLSKMQIGQLQTLITESVIRSLLAYLDVDGEFYRFPLSIKSRMQLLCDSKQLIGKVKKVSMSPEPLEYIHKHTGNQLRRLAKLPETVYVCELYDTSSQEKDLNITQALLQDKIAWPGQIPGAVLNDPSANDWQDIIITHIQEGGIFWAQIGEATITTVAEIQAVVNKGSLGRKERVIKGENLVVFGEIQGIPCYFRAQVMRIKDSMVDVFALDYGCTILVNKSELFELPEELQLSLCPQNASLCTVAGIQAPPFDEGLVNNATAILANLCKQSRRAGELLEKMSGLEILDKLLQKCQATKIVTQVVILVSNLCCNANMNPQMTNTNILQTLLGVLNTNIERADQDCHLVTSCLSCLVNLLHNNSSNRKLFYQNQGIDAALKVICNNKRSSPLYLMAAKLLRIFIGRGAAITDQQKTHSSLTDLHRKDLNTHMSTKKGVIAEPLVSMRRNLLRDSDRLKPETVNCKSLPAADRVDQSRLSKVVPRHSGTESSSDETSNEIVVRGQHEASSDKLYIRDSRVKWSEDLTHEIRPNKEIFTISNTSIAPHLCAILNSGHGGTIYFGIGKNRKVFGLEMNRDEKDQFRLGIDQLVHRKIIPVILHSQFDVVAVPVLDPETHSILKDLYVIEISVKGSSGTIYTLSDGSCYYRFGSATSSVTLMELRQLIVLEVENEFHVKLTKLRQERDRLREVKKSKQTTAVEGKTENYSE